MQQTDSEFHICYSHSLNGNIFCNFETLPLKRQLWQIKNSGQRIWTKSRIACHVVIEDLMIHFVANTTAETANSNGYQAGVCVCECAMNLW